MPNQFVFQIRLKKNEEQELAVKTNARFASLAFFPPTNCIKFAYAK